MRYRLREELFGVDLIEVDSTIGTIGVRMEGRELPVYLPRAALTEIPPPIPAEPEPGAYLIGGVPVIHSADPQAEYGWLRETVDGSSYDTWADTWKELGGPDVAIVPLIPDPAHGVTLPWKHLNNICVRVQGETTVIDVGEDGVRVTPDLAHEFAAAILAGARDGAP